MSINVDLLRRTLDHVETDPESWDQEWWAIQHYKDGSRCGTAFCFAGHAVLLAGHEVIPCELPEPIFATGPDFWAADALPGWPYEPIKSVAQRELGLDDDQADKLFKAGNTLEDLRRIVDELVAEADAEARR